MSDLNSQTLNLKKKIIEDKLGVENYKIFNLKNDIENVLKNYTKSDSFCIKINIKILSTGDYKLEFSTVVKEFY